MNPVRKPDALERVIRLIDWADEYPAESSLQIAVRQSTVCPCGAPKAIGQATCGHKVSQ
jgi:hypothetical protein